MSSKSSKNSSDNVNKSKLIRSSESVGKGVQTHIVIVAIVSFFITLLLVTLLSGLFKIDNENCKYIHYEIKKVTTSGKNLLILSIENTGNRKVNFKVNEKFLSEALFPGEKRVYRVNIKKDTKSAVILPVIKDFSGNMYECMGKRKFINLNVILKNGER